ncbi:MAG: Mur ligase family protein [Candidatus Saccharibacteria bacterium]|nr:Mur ligase family protein [Candidatus Saccharibacteria bacterium]
MAAITNIGQAEAVLAAYIAEMRAMTGKDITVERMRPLMASLGDPHKKLAIIHIAGTSGKTSTSYYIADLLRRSGQHIGLTVSPHIDSIAERVQIDGEPISEQLFCQSLSEVLDRTKSLSFRPTYFEILIGLAFWVFANHAVDYVVIETGLGGLHDATNVADSDNKVAVITDIGLDHMHILGRDVESIARQKAGIIHPGNQVFMLGQPSRIITIIKEQVERVGHGAQLNLIKDTPHAVMPVFQARNWSLAKAVVDYVAERDELPSITKADITASQRLAIPGRMNRFDYQGRTIVVDGAHNTQKMQALVRSLQAAYPALGWTVIAAFKAGKDYQSALPELGPITNRITFTKFMTGQDSHITSVDPVVLQAFSAGIGLNNGTVADDLPAAIQQALETGDSSPILITGSLYLAGLARAHLLAKK